MQHALPGLCRVQPDVFSELPHLREVMEQMKRELSTNQMRVQWPAAIKSRRMLYSYLRRRHQAAHGMAADAVHTLPRPSRMVHLMACLRALLVKLPKGHDATFKLSACQDDCDSDSYGDAPPQPLSQEQMSAFSEKFASYVHLRCCTCKMLSHRYELVVDVGKIAKAQLKELEAKQPSSFHEDHACWLPTVELVQHNTMSQLVVAALSGTVMDACLTPHRCVTEREHTVEKRTWPHVLLVSFEQVDSGRYLTGSAILPPTVQGWQSLDIPGAPQYELCALWYYAYPHRHYVGEHLHVPPSSKHAVWCQYDSHGFDAKPWTAVLRDPSRPSFRRLRTSRATFDPRDKTDLRDSVLFAVYRLR